MSTGKYGVDLDANKDIMKAIINVLNRRERVLVEKVIKSANKLLNGNSEALFKGIYDRIVKLVKLANSAKTVLNNIIKLRQLI